MNRRVGLLGGMGIGAGLAFMLDPDRGARRRALVRDKITRAATRTGDALGATSRDLAHRAQGAAARLRALRVSEEVPDAVLVERVRAKMGRIVSHPHAIDTSARDGRVRLSGPILAGEVNRLLRTVETVRGVRGIENALTEHKQAGNMPSLQGGASRPGEPRLYNPPAGAIGHGVAAVFGDPKSRIDEDLARMKTLIETGNPPHDAARPLTSPSKAM